MTSPTQPTIEIRPLSSQADLHACVALQRETWGASFEDVVPVSILKVCQRIGGVAAGAFDDAGRLLGFVFGMTGVERGHIVHWSDMLAVRMDSRNSGLGQRLKEFQRHAAREAGAETIYWTYDPLIARNAHINLNKLGARVTEFVEDMYGTTDSVLHGSLPTDRFIVAWSTRDEEIGARISAAHRLAESPDCRQAPIASAEWIRKVSGASILPHCVRVEIPTDAERMLAAGAREGARWRKSVRMAVEWAMAAGYQVGGFYTDDGGKRGYYLFTKSARMSQPAPRP